MLSHCIQVYLARCVVSAHSPKRAHHKVLEKHMYSPNMPECCCSCCTVLLSTQRRTDCPMMLRPQQLIQNNANIKCKAAGTEIMLHRLYINCTLHVTMELHTLELLFGYGAEKRLTNDTGHCNVYKYPSKRGQLHSTTIHECACVEVTTAPFIRMRTYI